MSPKNEEYDLRLRSPARRFSSACGMDAREEQRHLLAEVGTHLALAWLPEARCLHQPACHPQWLLQRFLHLARCEGFLKPLPPQERLQPLR